MIATSSNEIRIWDADGFNLKNEYSFNGKQVNWFCVRPDNTHLASIVNKDTINLINLETNDVITYKDINESKCCAYDTFSRYLHVGTSNGFIDIYDFKLANMKKKSFKVQNCAITCMSCSKNDRYIATGGVNGSIVLLSRGTNQTLKPLQLQSTKPPSVTYIQHSQQNANNFAAGYDDGCVVLWDSAKEKQLCSFKQHTNACTCLTLSPLNSILMISGSLDNSIACYDISSKKHIKTLYVNGGVVAMDLNKNGSVLAIGTANGIVQMFDLRSKNDEPFYSFKAHENTMHLVKFIYQNDNQSEQTLSATNRTSATLEDTLTTTIINSNGMKKSNSTQLIHEQTESELNTNQIKLNPYQTADSFKQAKSQNDFSTPSFILHQPQNQRHSSAITNNSNLQLNIDSNLLTPIINTPITTTITKPTTITTNGGISLAKTFVQNRANAALASTTNFLNTNDNSYSALRAKPALYSPLLPPNNDSSSVVNNDHSITSNQTANDSSIQAVVSTMMLENTVNEIKQSSPTLPSNQKQEQININKNTLNEPIDSTKIIPTALNKTPIHGNSTTVSTQLFNDSAISNIGVATPSKCNIEPMVLPVQQIKEFIKDQIDELRDELMNENFCFKAEVFKEFMTLREEIKESLKVCSVNDALVTEIKRLTDENKRLKKLF